MVKANDYVRFLVNQGKPHFDYCDFAEQRQLINLFLNEEPAGHKTNPIYYANVVDAEILASEFQHWLLCPEIADEILKSLFRIYRHFFNYKINLVFQKFVNTNNAEGAINGN